MWESQVGSKFRMWGNHPGHKLKNVDSFNEVVLEENALTEKAGV